LRAVCKQIEEKTVLSAEGGLPEGTQRTESRSRAGKPGQIDEHSDYHSEIDLYIDEFVKNVLEHSSGD
jgi:hypothetical protein